MAAANRIGKWLSGIGASDLTTLPFTFHCVHGVAASGAVAERLDGAVVS